MTVIGTRVGPFEIAQACDFPGPAEWYVARRPDMSRKQPSAVLVQLASDAGGLASLRRAFDRLRAHDDPRIPSVVGFYEGARAMAIQYVEGAPLSVLVRARADDAIPMTPPTLLDVLLELTDTLKRAHGQNLIHGHLDADVVWLAPDGHLWLLGWERGIAKSAEGWRAPERTRGQPPTAATDQWGLAALATALIVGAAPTGDSPTSHVETIERQWPALGRLLKRMLDPRPANRFDSMHPVRQALLALARKAGGTSDRRELGARLSRERPTVDRTTPDSPTVTPAPARLAAADPPPADLPTRDLPRTERFAGPLEPDSPTADHTPPDTPALEPLTEFLERLALQAEHLDDVDETMLIQDGGIRAHAGEDEETVLVDASFLRQAMLDDAVLVEGGGPTAVPVTESADPGVSVLSPRAVADPPPANAAGDVAKPSTPSRIRPLPEAAGPDLRLLAAALAVVLAVIVSAWAVWTFS